MCWGGCVICGSLGVFVIMYVCMSAGARGYVYVCVVTLVCFCTCVMEGGLH